MNLIQFLLWALLFNLFGSVISYPKYYISNYCGLLKGSALKFGENGRSVALLKLKRETYRPNMDCSVVVKAANNFGIIAYIKKVKLRKLDQQQDYLQVIADKDNTSSLVWFGSNEEIIPKVNLFSNPNKGEINIIFKSKNFYLALSGKGFKIVLTLYKMNEHEKCAENSSLKFNCNNKICIDKHLECDGINNCGNEFDEINCGAPSESKIGVFVFMATLTSMIFVVIFMCRTKKNRQKFAGQINKVYTTSGRKISSLFAPEIRHLVTVNQNSNHSTTEGLNSYTSLPIISSLNDQTNNSNNSDLLNK